MDKAPKNKIVVILGPTSSGKSDVAIRLAKKFGGEIISADSRQIYRDLDIGTGKEPGHWDAENNVYMASGVPHHMIDVVDPKKDYSVSLYKKKVDKITSGILRRKKLPIICGGTGFWIKAVVDNVIFPEVSPDWKLRDSLKDLPPHKLFEQLKKIDPDRAKTIDKENPARLIRAIEICRAIGKVPPANKRPPLYDSLQIGISIPKEILRAKIKKRLKKRFDAGMIEEVAHLHYDKKISWERLRSFGLGYVLIPQYLKKEIPTITELFEKTWLAETDYAKRQMTWFKKDRRIIWLARYRDMEKRVAEFLKN